MKGCRSERVQERKGAVVLLEPGTASSVHDLNIQSPPKMPTHSECSREVPSPSPCIYTSRLAAALRPPPDFSLFSKSSLVTTLGCPFAHVNLAFRPLTLGQILLSGCRLHPQKRPFPPNTTYFTHPEPHLHSPRHQTVTESHSGDFIIELGVACLSCLTPTALDGDPRGGRNLPLKSHLSWFSFSAPTQQRQAGEALLDPKPSPLEPELQGAKSPTARTQEMA
ncbi:uncharacterized protein [Alexandromys fortis]|uniref:uncharacterized protein n=1 Tax=Alexandromys fortis TaxID=100897 RepID=UPI002152E4FD|nr:uncharacterized protein LOC126512665 [Microtus fortis]